jgi:predicted Zn-dependent peptidase
LAEQSLSPPIAIFMAAQMSRNTGLRTSTSAFNWSAMRDDGDFILRGRRKGIANAIATSVRRDLPDGAIEKYVTDVRAVTKEQVEQAARQILRADAMVWLVIGDRSKVELQLRKAGIAYKVLTQET